MSDWNDGPPDVETVVDAAIHFTLAHGVYMRDIDGGSGTLSHWYDKAWHVQEFFRRHPQYKPGPAQSERSSGSVAWEDLDRHHEAAQPERESVDNARNRITRSVTAISDQALFVGDVDDFESAVRADERARAKVEIINWTETAAQYARNEAFYRDLLDETAKHLGPKVFIADDGSVMDEPIRLKIPGLVEAMKKAHKARLRDEAGMAWNMGEQHGEWLREPIGREPMTLEKFIRSRGLEEE